MNIWIVNHYAISPRQAGGTRHHSLAKELVKRGHQVTIFSSSFDHTTKQELHLSGRDASRREDIDGVTFIWLRTPPYSGNSPLRVWNMVVFAHRVYTMPELKTLPQPDVIIGSSPHPAAAWAAARLAKRLRVPFVMEVRDLWPQTLIDLGHYRTWHPVILSIKWLERHLYRTASRIVVLLPGAIRYITLRGIEARKITWLPNGVDIGKFTEVAAAGGSHGRFTVMYAGSHGVANALDSILDAAKILQRSGWGDRLRFRFVGDGAEKKRLMQRSVEEKIDIAEFESPVAKDDIYATLREADAFILTLRDSPLYRWGISLNKCYDYLAAGRPIIFGAASSYDPVADAGAGFTVPPEDAAAMAEAVKRVFLLAVEDRDRMGHRGRAYVEQHHSIQKLAERLESLLEETVRSDADAQRRKGAGASHAIE